MPREDGLPPGTLVMLILRVLTRGLFGVDIAPETLYEEGEAV